VPQAMHVHFWYTCVIHVLLQMLGRGHSCWPLLSLLLLLLLLLSLCMLQKVDQLPAGLQHLWLSGNKVEAVAGQGATPSLVDTITQRLRGLKTLGACVCVGGGGGTGVLSGR
jgi:hypothetical protein